MNAERWPEIETLYHAALGCDPSGRARLLQAAHPDIRREVELLLAQDGSLLDRPAWMHLPEAPPLAVGMAVDRYQIEGVLGAGGMGEVFRARDTRLGREVAIKTSRARFSGRFEREARAISALNHPHVCTLYDVGANYLVMELVEGETLASRLRRGKLPIEETLRFGVQIADALGEAHARQIVHRDLKPSNIMLTRHGVKVLDFGLAKMLAESGITETRETMGTPAYMAPEQLEHREPAGVADLFSLGLVLYEMATGSPPVPGASLGRMLASGARTAVDAPSERSSVPADFDRLISRLLERDPVKRPQSAAEVSRELSALMAAERPRGLLAMAVLASAVAIALASIWLLHRSVSRPAPDASFNPRSYVQLTSFTDSAVAPVLSPDGRMLAFFRSESAFLTPDQIWVKLLPDGEPRQVTHDPREKYGVAFSPDGTRIAYTVFGKLFHTEIVSALGGDPQVLLPNSAGLSWLDDAHVLFSEIKTGIHMGIVTSRDDRSALREIYFPRRDRGMVHYSYPSPDRKWLLAVEMDPDWQPCRLVPFSGNAAGTEVGPPGACTSAAWSRDGKWMYFAARVSGRSHLWRQRFPDGSPQQLTFGATEEDGIAVAPDNHSLITSIATRQNRLWIHDARGERALSSEGYAGDAPPLFSADGRRLYYLLRRNSPESPAELRRADPGSGKSEVILPGVSMRSFDISNDERQVVFSTQPDSRPSEIWISSLDRSSPPRRIASGGEATPRFGPHHEILFRLTEGNAYYLGAMARDGTARRKILPYPILGIENISPDRRFIVISAAVAGTRDANDRPTLAVPVSGGPPREICAQLCNVAWSPNGKYFYVEEPPGSNGHRDGKTVAVPVAPGKTLPPSPASGFREPEQWLQLPGAKIIDATDISPGPDLLSYAGVRAAVHANLFRIPLP